MAWFRGVDALAAHRSSDHQAFRKERRALQIVRRQSVRRRVPAESHDQGRLEMRRVILFVLGLTAALVLLPTTAVADSTTTAAKNIRPGVFISRLPQVLRHLCTMRRPCHALPNRLKRSMAKPPKTRLLGQPSALWSEGRRGVVDLTEILGGQLDLRCGDVLLEAVELRRPRNRDDPWLLSEKPGERDLCGRRVLALRDLRYKLDEREVRAARLGGEARDAVAEVGLERVRGAGR